MKIITEPKVTLVAKQIFMEHPEYDIPDDGNDAVKLGAFAAKGCYDSFSKTGRANEANQREVLKHEHGSVLEHLTATIFIEGISRALSLESNRHRQLAVSQRSTRYTAEEDTAIVLEPLYARLYEKHKSRFDIDLLFGWVNYDDSGVDATSAFEMRILANSLLGHSKAIGVYKTQVQWLELYNPLNLTGFDLRKWARGKARNNLPHALETRITYTGNMRAWRWFIEARSDKHAEPEIRRLADAVLTCLRKDFALYFEDFTVDEIYDGIPVWKPCFSKI